MTRQRGSVIRVGEVWRLRIRWAPAPGQPRRQVSHRLGTLAELPTVAAARRAADRLIDQVGPRRLTAATAVTWARWCDLYVVRHLVLLARGTRTMRESIIDCHLRPAPAFKGRCVHQIDVADCQRFVTDQRIAGVATSTIRSHFALIRRMLRAAAGEGLATHPPRADQIQFPRDEVVHDTLRHKAFTRPEVQQILATAPEPLRMAVALAHGLGLRASEVVGLSWSCIDLVAGTVDVRQQALDGVLRPLKSKSSRAVLIAPPQLLEDLRRFHAAQPPNPRGFLFASETGDKPLDARVLRRQLHHLLDQLGIRRRGFHGFRHACALAMADAAVSPEALRQALRHASLRVTAVYLSTTSEDVAAALRIVNASAGCSQTVPNANESAAVNAGNS